MSITKIDNYSNFNTPPYLLQQFKDTDVQKLLEAIDPQYNELETALLDLMKKVWIDTAEGQNLDVLGIHLGLDRAAAYLDEQYRIMLKIKSKVNASKGTAEALIEAVRYLYNATEIQYKIHHPGVIQILQNGFSIALNYYSLADDVDDLFITDGGDSVVVSFEANENANILLSDLIPVGTRIGFFLTIYELITDMKDQIVDNEGNIIRVTY